MGSRTQRRRKAKKALAAVMDEPGKAVIIHYSCESFYGRGDAPSPRITSIAVRHLRSGQATSFSIQKVAEIRLGREYAKEKLDQQYDDFERQMLDEFYAYVKSHPDYNWMHWRMRDSNYGFAALAHRYRVLKGRPTDIPDDRLFDLASLLDDIYGPNYINDHKLYNLIDRNGMSRKDILDGSAEATAFEKAEYFKLHQSTLRKVVVMAHIAERTYEGSLKTNAKWRDEYGWSADAVAEYVRENRYAQILLAVLTVVGGVPAGIALIITLLAHGKH